MPMLMARFRGADAATIANARAFAYGGSVIQDLGYYPFGSHFFTNLVHYTRSGDFVESMIRGARDVNEYAFALGALAHYTSDTTGHPLAVNRAVPLVYPKLRAKFGDEVTYVDDPKSHIMVEFAFDVVQVANGAFLPEAYHDLVGFQVATDLLDRAFHETYGLEMKDVFAAKNWRSDRFLRGRHTDSPGHPCRLGKQRSDIEKLRPSVERSAFVYTYTAISTKGFRKGYKRPASSPGCSCSS